MYFGGKFPHPQGVFVCWSQANWCSNQNSNCVNFLRKLEYNQKKCLRKISQMLMLKYLVFLDTGMVDNLIQAWASITMQVLQVPFTWMTNMRWIGTSNMTNRSRLQAKRKHSIPVRFDITCWPNSQCCAMTGKEGGIEWAQFEFTNVRKRNKPDSYTLFCVQFELNNDALKWTLWTLWSLLLSVTVFMLCIPFWYCWYKDCCKIKYKLLLMAFSELSEKKKDQVTKLYLFKCH